MKKDYLSFSIIFISVSFLIIVLNLVLIYFKMIQISPLSPWDAGIIVEAFRIENNQPVYEDYITGHATHMYGWFYNYILWGFFKIFSFNNYIPRFVTLFASLSLISILTYIICQKSKFYKIILIWALFFGINLKIGNYYIHNRPDVIAALFAVLSTIFIYMSYYRNNYLLFFVSLFFLFLAYSTKQTFAFVSLIPVCSFILIKDYSKKSVIYSAVPIITLLIIILFLYLFKPYYYFYMMSVPGMYEIKINKFIFNIIFVIFGSPVFIYSFFYWIFRIEKGYKNVLLKWTIVSIILSVFISSLSVAKIGGVSNSNLPAYISIYFFSGIILLKNINYFEENRVNPIIYNIWAVLISGLILISTFFWLSKIIINPKIFITLNFLLSIFIFWFMYKKKSLNYFLTYDTKILKTGFSILIIVSLTITLFASYKANNFLITEYDSYMDRVKQKNTEYSEIIKTAKDIKGNLISPEDPTIILYSKNSADRSIFFERDSNSESQKYMTEYFLNADYIIDVKGNRHMDKLTDINLMDLNFIKVNDKNNDLKYFTLWKNNN